MENLTNKTTEEKPSHYLCKVGHSLTAKNNLERSFVDFLKKLDGKLISANSLEQLQDEISEEALHLNTLHSRCKPLSIQFYRPGVDKHFALTFYTIDFKILDAFFNKEVSDAN